MGKRVEHLTAFDAPNLVRINQDLDELNREVDDARVSASAGISATKLKATDLGEVTVGTTEVVVRHRLGAPPFFLHLTMRSVGAVYESKRADANMAYLKADAAGRKVHVVAFG